jgi:prepilin-type N-terminal cleavage/methylation domain-containing protein
MFIKRLRSERGDTLVEVLIAIGVISLILGGAFVMTNRSLQGTRNAQERVNGVKLVEAQIEQIKGLAATDSDEIFGTSTPASFCISNAGAVVPSTNAACRVDISGAATSAEPIYNLAVTRSANTFTIRNTWNRVSGGQTSVEMKYRVYETE